MLRPATSTICLLIILVGSTISRSSMRPTGAKIVRLLVRHDRRRELRLRRLQLALHERRGVDPDRAAIERAAAALHGIEVDDVAVAIVDARHAFEAIGVVVGETQRERDRQHLLGLKQRKRGTIFLPLRSVDGEAQLLPLDAVAIDVEAVFGDDVVAGIGDGRPEVLLHARAGGVVFERGVLRGLRLLMTRDDFADRERVARGDVVAFGDDVAERVVEVDDERMRGERRGERGALRVLVAREVRRRRASDAPPSPRTDRARAASRRSRSST